MLSALENTFFNWQFDGLSHTGHLKCFMKQNGLSISLNALLNTELNSNYSAWLSFSTHPEGNFWALCTALQGDMVKYKWTIVQIQNPAFSIRFASLWKAQIIVLCNQYSYFFRMTPVQLQNKVSVWKRNCSELKNKYFFFPKYLPKAPNTFHQISSK